MDPTIMAMTANTAMTTASTITVVLHPPAVLPFCAMVVTGDRVVMVRVTD